MLFDSIEQSFGAALSGVAFLVYAIGLVAVAVAGLAPLHRRWVERMAIWYGLQQVWILPCPKCGKTTRAAGDQCGYCEQPLDLPATLKWWSRATRNRPSRAGQHARWGLSLCGNAAFLLLTLWLILTIDALKPEGALHRLFLGVALLSWALVGWFSGRALRLASQGLPDRIRDGFLAFAFLAPLLVMVFLAQEARSIPETLLARFTAERGMVRIASHELPISAGEIQMEYLQLDHHLLGYHEIIPLAFHGDTRLELSLSPMVRLLVAHLRSNPDAYASRGLLVRLRTDRQRITPGALYEVIERRGQVVFRRAG